MESVRNVGKTNIFHDSPPDKSWEMLVFLPRFPPISHEFGETSGAGVAVSAIMESVGNVGDVGQQNSRVLDFRGLGFRV